MWYMGGYSQPPATPPRRTASLGQAGARRRSRAPTSSSPTCAIRAPSGSTSTSRIRAQRYKLFRSYNGSDTAGPVGLLLARTASTGASRWRRAARPATATTVFYNPFRKVWVYSLRDNAGPDGARTARLLGNADVVAGTRWKAGRAGAVGRRRRGRPADGHDLQACRRSSTTSTASPTRACCSACSRIWRGEPTTARSRTRSASASAATASTGPGPIAAPSCRCRRTSGDWNWGNVQSAGGCCLVVGDQLYFYVSGRPACRARTRPGICSTGLATLRRDGFASMDHPGPAIRRRIDADRHADDAAGALPRQAPVRQRRRGRRRAAREVLDRDGRVIPVLRATHCVPVRADRTRRARDVEGRADLARLAGKPVRFRFHLRHGSLYAFWVSPSADGASHGYVAAGGPGIHRAHRHASASNAGKRARGLSPTRVEPPVVDVGAVVCTAPVGQISCEWSLGSRAAAASVAPSDRSGATDGIGSRPSRRNTPASGACAPAR